MSRFRENGKNVKKGRSIFDKIFHISRFPLPNFAHIPILIAALERWRSRLADWYKNLHSVTIGRRYMHLKIFEKIATHQFSSPDLMHSREVFQKSERLICSILRLISNKNSFNRFKRKYPQKVDIQTNHFMAISRVFSNRFPFSFS